jgi:integrase
VYPGDVTLLGSGCTTTTQVHGTKRDAQDFLAKTLTAVSTGTFTAPSKESLAEYLPRWLATTVALRVRQRTAEDYKALAVAYLVPRLGNLKLSQLTPENIETAYAELTADGLSSRTVRYAHSVLHAALTTAVERKHLPGNPASLATLPRDEHREMRAMTQDEATRFLAAARGTRLEALWAVLLTGGLRPGEALGLKWSDLQENRVRILRSLVRHRDHTWKLEDPKTPKARRSIPLPAGTIRALRRTGPIRQRSGFGLVRRGLITI